MKKIFFMIITSILFTTICNSQTTIKKNDGKIFNSSKYNYKILIPEGYVLKKAIGKHIDYKVVGNNGKSITVNVSNREKEEYSITAHNYSRNLFENSFDKYYPNTKILNTEKIYIDNIKAFLMECVNNKYSTNTIEVYFFKDDYAYLLTGTCERKDYNSKCKKEFLNTFYSLKFE